MKLVECVPNFSEGRNKETIQKIADAIQGSPGAALLDVDPGSDTNRTVYTFVGEPEAVLSAAFNAIKVGQALIDMSRHTGAHPRIGACDVCPFVPVAEVTMEECAELARRLGRRVAQELGIPVYLYEQAASRPERRNLADVRAGEYEGLARKIALPEWKPDFGPIELNDTVRKSGATVAGAREFLIAYNLDVNSRDKAPANAIAKRLRQSGEKRKNPDGTETFVPGLFKECKAIGWYVADYDRAQVSINLTNYHVTNMHQVFDAAVAEGEKIGVRITGSEVVGLVPLQALREAGLHYAAKQESSRALSEKELIHLAILSLGLNDAAKFDPQQKIIDYKIKRRGLLTDLTVQGFTDELASKSPAPGGGSVAALDGSIAAGLVAMVGNLTYKKKEYRDHWVEAERIAFEAHALKDRYAALIDRDTDAFNEMMAAFKSEDDARIAGATRKAALVPFEVASLAAKVLPLLERIAMIGNRNAISDAGVAALNLEASFTGAKLNVLINLKDFSDRAFAADLARKLAELQADLFPRIDKVVMAVEAAVTPK
jgi:glutamate formiminotransferase / formiminotetrahydrofolate cyclodeaminase